MVRGEEVLFCTSGEAVTVLDYETQKFRPTKLTDLYDAARLGDQLDHIHTFGQPFIAAEYSSDVFVHDVNIAYAELAGTNKSFALGIAVVDHVDVLVDLFDTYLGEQGAFLKRPFCTFGGCPIVSPLRFGEDNAQVLVRVAELGLVADIAVAPQAGATAPAALAGTYRVVLGRQRRRSTDYCCNSAALQSLRFHNQRWRRYDRCKNDGCASRV